MHETWKPKGARCPVVCASGRVCRSGARFYVASHQHGRVLVCALHQRTARPLAMDAETVAQQAKEAAHG